jgi:hypothetical protein
MHSSFSPTMGAAQSSLTQCAAIRNHLGDLGALDLTHPSGRFILNLSRAPDRLIALRLQECACLERPWLQNKMLHSWRNVTLNGLPVAREALSRMREWTLPTSGQLKLDYVCYKVSSILPGLCAACGERARSLITCTVLPVPSQRPDPSQAPCCDNTLNALLSAIREAHRMYRAGMLQVSLTKRMWHVCATSTTLPSM